MSFAPSKMVTLFPILHNHMRKNISFVIAFFLLLTACTQQVDENREALKVGGIFALSGLGASQGQQELNAATLAVEDVNANGGVNGHPLELIAEDVSLDKLNKAASAAHKLLNVDKVVAIVGTTWDEPAQAILPIIEGAHVPMVGPNQTRMLEADTSYEYFFNVWYDNAVGIRTLLSFAKSQGIKSIAVIRPIPAGFYQYVADRTAEIAPEFGIDIVSDIALNDPAPSDYRTPLAKVMQKKPDAILMVLNGGTACTFLKQVREMGINVPILSTEAAGDAYALQACPDLMEKLYFSYPKESKQYEDFAQKYEKRFGKPPQTPSAVTAYDAVRVIAEGLKRTDGQGGSLLRDAIGALTIDGVSQPKISFDDIGYARTPPDAYQMRTVRSGSFVLYEE